MGGLSYRGFENDFLTNEHPDKLSESCTTFLTRESYPKTFFKLLLLFPKLKVVKPAFFVFHPPTWYLFWWVSVVADRVKGGGQRARGTVNRMWSQKRCQASIPKYPCLLNYASLNKKKSEQKNIFLSGNDIFQGNHLNDGII